MPRILRSQGIYKLFPPILAAPAAVFVAPPIRTQLAVQTARKAVGRYPSEGWSPWATVCDDVESRILDNFNRPDGALGANWQGPLDPADTGTITVLSNQCDNQSATFGDVWWKAQQFGPDQGAFFTLRDTVNIDVHLFARVSNPGTAGYNAYYTGFAVGDNIGVYRIDAGVLTQLGGFITAAPATGDRVGFTVIGSTITVYVNGVPLGTRTDTTYNNAGFIGIGLNNGGTVDDFGGGNVAQMGMQRTPIMGLRPPAVICPAEPVAQPVRSRLAPSRRPVARTYRRPPAVVAAGVAPPPKARTVTTRPRHTTYVLGRPTTLRVFSGPESWLTKTRPRPTTHVLRPPAVVAPRLLAPPLRTVNVHTRPARTSRTLRPPATLQVFAGPRSVLTRTRPRPTVHALRPAQVVLVPAVELKEETIRVALVRGRAGKTDYRLNPPAVVTAPAVFTGPTSRLTRIRPAHTIARLSAPAVVAPRPLAPPVQSRLVRTRPRHTIYRLEAPTTLTVFSGPRSELTKARPQPTTTVLVPAQVVRVPSVELLEETLRVRLVQTRPRPTTTLLRPPAVVLTPIPPEIDIHTAIVRGRRPIAKSRLFRPATLEPFSIQLREQTIRVALVKTRPRKTTLKLRPPTVLVVLRFSTGKPVLVRIRPQPTVATLRGPVVLRTFATGETRLVITRPRHTITVLSPPAVVRIPSIEQQQRTLRVNLVKTRPRHTVTHRPEVVRYVPEVTKVRAALAQARPRPTTRTLRAPAALRVFAGPVSHLVRVRPRHTIARLYAPTVVTPFVAPVLANIRAVLTRIRPPHTLAQLFPPRRLKNVPGHACLTDEPANIACLTDQLADVACLEDAELATEACLTNQLGAVACLVDLSAAHATLRDEE